MVRQMGEKEEKKKEGPSSKVSSLEPLGHYPPIHFLAIYMSHPSTMANLGSSHLYITLQ